MHGREPGGPARTVALRACISMREDSEKGELERRKNAGKSKGGRNAERGTEGKRLRRDTGAGGRGGQKGWQKGTFRTFFVC